jgi:hypothetical protein
MHVQVLMMYMYVQKLAVKLTYYFNICISKHLHCTSKYTYASDTGTSLLTAGASRTASPTQMAGETLGAQSRPKASTVACHIPTYM